MIYLFTYYRDSIQVLGAIHKEEVTRNSSKVDTHHNNSQVGTHHNSSPAQLDTLAGTVATLVRITIYIIESAVNEFHINLNPIDVGTPGVSPDVERMFSAVDTDRSGKITPKELQQALQNGKGQNFSDRCCQLLVCMYLSNK